MRLKTLMITAAAFSFLSAPAIAAGCAHYAGHFDLEGKIGSNRNIGEASAFLPIACTQDRLLFTDLKFRADNLSNREANIGIGARAQREDGIAGGYIYLDRKKSGETDKFYNQITTGAEWLADHWETRANVYIPLNGSKTIGNGVVVSDPYLAGTGIFIDRGGFQIKETPMYGVDAEIGFQTTENLWLYGGGFTFHGDDVPTITGARVRAKYDLTEKVSLNAEGQYDDERGRQGWLGARLSVPFGNVGAMRSRMTQSPVRDVDIVTQAKTTFEPQTTTALANPDSGDAQRVIYVNNRAAANGDGSLEKPYNTLVDAQGDLRDYDIVYVFHGDGSTTGQDQGFLIDKNHVSFIGEGSPLTFAGYTLRQAGKKPLITNIAGRGIYVLNSSAHIEGIRVQEATNDGIRVEAIGEAVSIEYVSIKNVDVVHSNAHEIFVQASDKGNIKNLILDKVFADGEIGGNSNVNLRAVNEGSIDRLDVRNVKSINSPNQGIYFYATTEGQLGDITLTLSEVHDSGAHGVFLDARSSSSIGNVKIDNLHSFASAASGVRINLQGESSIGNIDIDSAMLYNSDIGLSLWSRHQSSQGTITITNSDFVNNGSYGIYLNDDTDKVIDVAIANNNRIFGNAIADVRLDLDGETVDMRNNWWGQDTGPQAGQIINEDSGSNTGIALTSPWLTSDPRP